MEDLTIFSWSLVVANNPWLVTAFFQSPSIAIWPSSHAYRWVSSILLTRASTIGFVIHTNSSFTVTFLKFANIQFPNRQAHFESPSRQKIPNFWSHHSTQHSGYCLDYNKTPLYHNWPVTQWHRIRSSLTLVVIFFSWKSSEIETIKSCCGPF